MKAVAFTKYGPPEVLRMQERPRPEPGQGEVLVKIRATAVNDYDWSLVRGKPRIYRLMFGLLKPKRQIPGMELAGVVEACGPGANILQPGDEVYGDTSDDLGFGTFAEYISVKESSLRIKPGAMSFEEAASIPHAAGLALQGLRDYGNIQKGQAILINGAGGGMGTFALQIARGYSDDITGVDTGPKLAMMRDLGFDSVIDYQQEDFTKSGRRYDLILDAKTNRSPFAYARALKPNGRYVSVGGSLPRLLQILAFAPSIRRLLKKSLRVLPLKPNEGLDAIEELFAAGKLRCVIDGPQSLQNAAWAVQYFGEGRHCGKLVLTTGEYEKAPASLRPRAQSL